MTASAPPPAFVVLAHPPRPSSDRSVVGDGERPSRVERTSRADRLAPRRFELLSEIALVALSVSAVLSLGRLFDHGSFLAPLVLITIVGHSATALLRHQGTPSPVVAITGAVGGAILLPLVLYPGTTFFGLPTAHTLSTARTSLSEAWELFGRVAAPAPVEVGFVLAAALAMWVVVWFSDWAAFRLDAVIEATLPAGAVFIFGAMLGGPRHRTITTMVFLGALLSFLLSHRVARQARSGTWVGEGAASGGRTNLGRGLAVVLVTVLAAGVVGPRLPGTGAEPLVDWRNGGSGPGTRVTVSPLVDIRQRLVDQSDVELFQVRSNKPAYWRLTALGSFDGTVWSSSGSFAEADGELPADDPEPSATTLSQDFTILNLAAIWLPAAFNPASVRADTGVRWDDESSTLIVDANSDSSDNVRYRVESDVPRFRRADLDRNIGAVPLSIASGYTDLPDDFPSSVKALAARITASGRNPFEVALRLQDYFRNGFTYDLDTGAGHDERAIESFLESRRGYCEQFAGTFAAMARSVGLPARVAVGFTQGDPNPDSVDRYIVKGKHAHAWPEVYLNQVGWVAFEPTPGRGAPGAEDYTGVPPDQAGGTGAANSTTTSSTPNSTPLPSGSTVVTSPSGRLDTAGAAGFGANGGGGPSGPAQIGRAILVAVLAAGAWVGALGLARVFRRAWRRRTAQTPADRVRLSWRESTEAVATVGPAVQAWETHGEYVGRAAERLGEASIPLRRLAELASVATWSAPGADQSTADEAGRLSAEVHRRVKLQLDPGQKLRAAIDPRPLLRG